MEAVVVAIDAAGQRLAQAETRSRYSSRQGWWRKATRRNPSGEVVSLPSEDAITDALIMELEELRNEALPGDPLLEMNVVFAGQQPRRTQTRIGPGALTTDIRAHVPGQRDLDMRIEAKVLFSRSDLTQELLGPRGMLRFSDRDDPYADTPVGAMLAYVVAPCGADWGETMKQGLRSVPDAIGIESVSIGGTELLACDLLHSAGRGRVTVLHMNQTHHTSPSSWPEGTC